VKPRLFDFEGEQLSAAEIQRRVPAISETSVRQHLAAGRNTREAMLTYRPQWAKPKDQVRFSRKVEVANTHGRHQLGGRRSAELRRGHPKQIDGEPTLATCRQSKRKETP
jgi:hypothetical protein